MQTGLFVLVGLSTWPSFVLRLGLHSGEPLPRGTAAQRNNINMSINQSKRKTSNANGQTNLGHKHKAPDHNHEATQPMVDLPHTS